LIDFRKILKYEISQKSVQQEPKLLWTDRWADMTMLIVPFCHFANMIKNDM